MAIIRRQSIISIVKSNIYHEFLVTEALLRSNAGTTLGGYLFATLPRLILLPLSISSAFQVVLKICVLSLGFQYSLDIVNQTTGVAEDSINKPYRPIPSGLITIHGGECRWIISWTLFPLVSFLLSGWRLALWALFWQAQVGMCYVWPKFNNPVARNLFTALGTFIIISLVNEVVANSYPDRNLRIVLRLSLAAWAGLVIQIQEFHDLEGDKIAGKRTLPLVIGKERIRMMRYATCWIFVSTHILFLILGFKIAHLSSWSRSIYVIGVAQLVLGTGTGLRVVLSTSVDMDKNTYFYWLTTLFWVMVVYVSFLGTGM